ncbi:hypothetical protein VSU16_02560 [Cetobacterium somerae]|uniref:hypothetical protein n=1 Tax=Cetobacterium somerae TaxID=188913 RepID=UPI002E7B594A|nr:hypothetical protein [Cetobacterium somerae]WVJ01623.1 hypothetical protein VSU16_02560 [Cetobacterium somerae]
MKEECLLVIVNQSYKEGMTQEEIYKIARKSWRVSLDKLSSLKYVFAISNSKIVGMFECYDWHEIKDEKNLEYNGENLGRKYFNGTLVKENILKKYLSSDISFITKQQQTPTLYLKDNVLRKYRVWLEDVYVTRKNTKLDKITVDASIYRLNKNIEKLVENSLIEDTIFFFLLNSEELTVLKEKLEQRIGKLKDYAFAFNSFIAFKKFIETGENFIKNLDIEDNIKLIENGEIKMEYQRIVYGAPGTGKSYMLEKESKEKFKEVKLIKEVPVDSEDENDEVNKRRYWGVGAFWGPENKLDEFVEQGYWENGWDDKFIDKVKGIKIGDYIAIKSAFVTRPNGIPTATVRIKALGVVTKESDDGKIVKVDWKLKNLSNDYVGVSIRPTIQEVTGDYLKIFEPLFDLENDNSKSLETVEEILKLVERVTFYDGYTYGQFVGTYKPVPSENNSENIIYKYIPGPLMTSLVKAFQNPEHNFLLIIEEINRAKADRVFGNIFQLLDRNKSGESEYPIAISTEVEKYLREQFEDDSQYQEYFGKGLSLPSNLYIWATMNNADQGVYPLDTAFKRRWNFEYIGLDDNANSFGDEPIEYHIDLEFEDANEKITRACKSVLWNNFRENLNIFLLKNGVNEDRLIAPFFINSSQFSEDAHKIKDIFWIDESPYLNKLLMYIFDDVLKHKVSVRRKLFTEDILSFSQLVKKYKTGKCIYSDEFLASLDIQEWE